MADIPPSTPPAPAAADPAPGSRSPSRWRRLALRAGAFLLLALSGLAGIGFYLTSDSGFRAWVLPKISRSLGVDLAAARVHWSPLSSIQISNLRVGPPSQPILLAREFTLQYRGLDFLRGNYRIESLVIENPIIDLEKRADGTFANLPSQWQPSPTSTPSKTPQPPSVTATSVSALIASVRLTDLDLTWTTPDGISHIDHFQFDAKNLRPGGSASLDLKGSFKVSKTASASPSGPANKPVTGQIQSALQVDLDESLIPRSAKGQVSIDRLTGEIGGQSLNGLAAIAKLELAPSAENPSVLKQASIEIQRDGAMLTTMTAMGPVDFSKQEASLDIQVGPLKSNVLNLLFASQKIDFQNSSLSYGGHLWLTKSGSVIKAEGRLDATPLNLALPDAPSGLWKPVTLSAEHIVEVDFSQRRIMVGKLNVDATQEDKPLLKGAINKPMSLTWGESTASPAGVPDSEFSLQIFPFDLTSIVPLLRLPDGWKLASGLLDGNLMVTTTDQGHQLAFEGRCAISQVSLGAPDFKLTNAALSLAGKAALKDLKSVQFQALAIRATQNGKPLATATLDGSLEFGRTRPTTGAGILQLETPLPEILAIRPIPNWNVSTGSLTAKLEWSIQGDGRIESKTDAAFRDLTFSCNDIHYEKAALTLSGQIRRSDPQWELKDAAITALLDGQPAGSWRGSFSLNTKTADYRLAFKMRDWKETIFKPVFAAWLPDRKLRSIELTSEGELRSENGALTLTTRADVKNLLVESPGMPALKPLNAALTTDLTRTTNGTTTLRALQLQLDPTPAAKNLFQVTGVIKRSPDLSSTDLKIQGQSLDLTSYYDQLFGAPAASNNTAPPPSAPTTARAASAGSAPPPATGLPPPVRNVNLLIAVDSLKIHDFTVTDLNIPFRRRGDALELTDGKLKIGGAPVTATIRSEQGKSDSPFQFEIKTESLAFGPIVDILKPDLKGLVDGKLTAQLMGTARGMTRASLQQSLDGVLQVAVREAHFERVPGVRSMFSDLGKSLQSPAITSGTMDRIDVSAKLHDGIIATDNFHAGGSATEFSLRGTMDWEQKINMEASLKLKREAILASPLLSPILQLAGNDNAPWIKLPANFKVGGTLEAPEIDKNLGELIAKTFGSAALKQGLNILKELFQPKKDPAQQQQQPPPGQPDQPQQQQDIPLQDILNIFKKKK